jgi:hypothetical protein
VCAIGQISDRWRKPLYDGFEGKDFSVSGGLYFKRNPEQDAGLVEFQSQVTYSGNGALKLSLGAGREEAGQDGSQRAEIWERPELWVPYNRGIWYGFAVKFEEPIPQDDHRYVIAQWKREIAGTLGDFSPFLALRLNRGKLFATVETNLVARVGRQGQATCRESGETACGCDLKPIRPVLLSQPMLFGRAMTASASAVAREISLPSNGEMRCHHPHPAGSILSSIQNLAQTAQGTSRSLRTASGS